MTSVSYFDKFVSFLSNCIEPREDKQEKLKSINCEMKNEKELKYQDSELKYSDILMNFQKEINLDKSFHTDILYENHVKELNNVDDLYLIEDYDKNAEIAKKKKEEEILIYKY